MNKNVIIGCAIVGTISLAVMYSAPISDIWKGITALPFAGALCGVLIQLIRDDAAHQRRKELMLQEQQYSLSASSHMANTVFDKQVEFSQLYVENVLDAFESLRQQPEWEEAHDYARTLTMLRLKYMCWLTAEVDQNLGEFEQKLRTLGANSAYIKMPKGEGTQQAHRDAAAREMLEIFSAFAYVLDKSTGHQEVTLASLSQKMRSMLGVEELAHHKKRIIGPQTNFGS
ncbi:hypothetical protein KI701_17565 [Vibrio sp. D415a]|uniref:hypothetical protein n=1 Tax=Vibrio TaxID=662 RepID=UPI002555EA9A|nr:MULTISPECIES: hypothetical protein [unclassified Vibrio]EJL6785553.1 hypothetical protein [Vibrio alginolyticus]ELA9461237.1 hypothetical protein [Vibrio alginolyticus]MDK9730001.1 hypothetical protein [Vibrio sp. D415a]MDK9748331.1 hypothetical protein [Vibrio sp. D409a]MDK9769612.1 hypothetical protein [Vibrio sp. D417a]